MNGSIVQSFFSRERFKTPGQLIGIGGFSLFARVRERTALKSSIPTNYVEDGTPLNDHIIREPEVLTIEGVVGDIYRGPETDFLQVTPLLNTLGVINAYVPQFTTFQAVVMNRLRDTTNAAMNRLNDLLRVGNQANNFLGNLDISSKPLGEQFLDAMENIHYGNQLVSIDMPYRVYESMAITNIVIDRDNTGSAIAFTIEAQRFRIAELNFVAVSSATNPSKNPAPSTGGQTEGVKDIGTQAGTKRERSFLQSYNPFND
jgi:hypothetical protein